MSTPTASALRTAPAPRMTWIPIAVVFVIGAALGGVASMSFVSQTQNQQVVADPAAPNTELTRLLGSMDAAAQRGETRLFIQFREELAGLIRAAGMADYEALRGIDISED